MYVYVCIHIHASIHTCHARITHIMFCNILSYNIRLCNISHHHILSYPILSYPITSYQRGSSSVRASIPEGPEPSWRL